MTTAPVLFTPAPRNEPRSFIEPQPHRHLRLVESTQLALDDLLLQDASVKSATSASSSAARAPLPEGDQFARSFFTAVAETMVARRSVEHLTQHATLPVLQWLRSVRPRGRSSDTPAALPRVRTVHVCHVRDGVCEATAVIQHGPHVRAMNARFIGLDGRWQCSQLELV